MTTSYLPFPDFDQVILPLWGPLAVRWYSLAYIVGTLLGWLHTPYSAQIPPERSDSGAPR